ncbi:MAG TPA: efflux RND transporter periplasmic adaptor subunit [Polyangiaceae bacterium]|nr:efflux RND transporter periplasmic adaptor subunit [Polyangiaceae bacterium]
MDQPLPASVTPPPTDPSHDPTGPRPKAPLVGVLTGLLLVAGFVGWAGTRIQAATQAKKEVAAQRDEDARRTNAAARATPVVATVLPKAGTWDPVVEIDGTVAAGQSAEIGFKTGGRIAQVAVKVGDTVKAGQLLATLDASEAVAQLRAAQAQQRAAQAQLALATDTEHRTQSMVQSGAIAEATGVQTIQQKALASAQAEASQAQVALTQVSIANHRLSAPFGGSVTRAPDGVGGVTAPGTPLFEIVDLTRLKLKGTLSEQDATLVEPGAPISIETEHGAVTGKVSAVLGSVDPSTRRVRIEATLDNQGSKLRAGTFVRATLKGKAAINVLSLPREALRTGSQNEVLVVENGALASRRLSFAIATDGSLLVRHGLGANERVVLSPKSDAQVGDRVVAEDAPAKALGTTAAPAPPLPAAATSASATAQK